MLLEDLMLKIETAVEEAEDNDEKWVELPIKLTLEVLDKLQHLWEIEEREMN